MITPTQKSPLFAILSQRLKWFLSEFGHISICVFNRRFFTSASGNVVNSPFVSSSCWAGCTAQSSAGAGQRNSFPVNGVEPHHAMEDVTPWDSACSVKWLVLTCLRLVHVFLHLFTGCDIMVCTTPELFLCCWLTENSSCCELDLCHQLVF